MNETYRKVLQIFVMKNYAAALVAKLQSRNLPLPRDYFAVSALCSIHVLHWAKNATNLYMAVYLLRSIFFREIP